MDGKSLIPHEEKLKQLKDILPEAFSEGKVDWEKLKAALGEDINFSSERYVLNWAGKSDAFKVLQMPGTGALFPVRDESVNFDETGNIFIEGENLEVLKVLQKSYFSKIKMIYIDPPYNTGNDSFIYPDNFAESREDYQKRVGDKDEEGYMTKEGLFRKNSRENGQYHSNWLNMIYPRLFLAKNLLRDDGVIFVSIDDNEVHNLRLVMNEVFGEENFISQLVWEKKKKGTFLSNSISSVKEYVLVYCKNNINFGGLIGEINSKEETYPCINDSNKREIRKIPKGIISKFKEKNYKLAKGSKISVSTMELLLHSDLVIENSILKEDLEIEGNWRYRQDAMTEYAEKGELYITQDLYLRRIVNEPRHKTLKDLLPRVGTEENSSHRGFEVDNLFNDGWGSNEDGEEELRTLMNGKNLVDYPKPVKLIGKLIASVRDTNALILDFFAGSGTSAHSTFDLNNRDKGNRKFICVQIPEPCDEKSEAFKAGYKTIADIAKERIRRAIKKIKEEDNGKIDFGGSRQDLGFKVFRLAESNFKQWRSNIGNDLDALKQQLIEFIDPVAPNAVIENMVYELLLKSGKDLNSGIEHKENYYCINKNELILMLEKADQDIADAVLKENPQKVIALDRIFEDNDQLKTNTSLQMKDAGIEFKTV